MIQNYIELSDPELATRLKTGDESAYTEIYNRYWAVLFRHARRFLQNEDEVKDIIQEVFLTLWTKGPELNITVSLSAFLYAAVRNRIFNHIDHSKVKANYMASMTRFIEQGEFITDNMVREKELARLIEEEIEALPPKMREIFNLSRKANLSYKTIAEQMNIADNTVKKQVSKAIKVLRLKFGMFFSLFVV